MRTWEQELSDRLQKTKPKISLAHLIDQLNPADFYQVNIWSGVIAAAKKFGVTIYCLQGGPYHDRTESEPGRRLNETYDLVDKKKMQGVLILGSLGTYVSNEAYRDLHLSYRPLPTISIGTPIDGISSVTAENYTGIYLSVFHMAKIHHCRRIAFIRGPVDVPEANERYRAYLDALRDCEIEADPELSFVGSFLPQSGIEAVQEWMDLKKKKIDAIVGANDNMIMGAVQELRRRNYRVPADIAVSGFDDTEESRFFSPGLTTVKQPLPQLGEYAVKLLLAKIVGVDCPETLKLETELILRQSCGCAHPSVEMKSSQRRKTFSEIFIIKANHREHQESFVQEALELMNVKSPDFREILKSSSVTVFDSFFKTLNRTLTRQHFYATVEDLVFRVVSHKIEFRYWDYVTALLLKYSRQMSLPESVLDQANELIDELKRLIADLRLNLEIYGNNVSRNEALRLSQLSAQLNDHDETQTLLKVIEGQVPRLGVRKLFIVLFEHYGKRKQSRESASNAACLLFAMNDQGRIELNKNTPFPTRDIFNQKTLRTETTLLLMPLSAMDYFFGYILFEPDSALAHTYSMIQKSVSSVIYGSILFRERLMPGGSSLIKK